MRPSSRSGSSPRQAATRRRNILTGSLAAGLVVALSLAGLAYWQRQVAVDQRQIAIENQIEAQNQRQAAEQERDHALTTQSRFLADLARQASQRSDHSLAIGLALSALPARFDPVDRPIVPEAEAALYDAVTANQELTSSEQIGEAISFLNVDASTGNVIVASRSGIVVAWPPKLFEWPRPTINALFAIRAHDKGIRFQELMGLPIYPDLWHINHLTVSKDGTLLATASGDESVRLWNAVTGALRFSLEGDGGPVRGVAFSPDGSILVTGSRDGKARMWNTQSGELLRTLPGPEGTVLDNLIFSPTGDRLLAAWSDKSVRIWDLSGQLLTAVTRPAFPKFESYQAAFSSL